MKLWWIAINGASCARASFALSEPFAVVPTPEILVGFRSEEEAVEAQRICLNEPIPLVKKVMRQWIGREDVTVRRPANPGQPTKGSTVWAEL